MFLIIKEKPNFIDNLYTSPKTLPSSSFTKNVHEIGQSMVQNSGDRQCDH